MDATHRAIQNKARTLYQAFPGAAQPPVINTGDARGTVIAWGEVEDTPEYRFCVAIAGEIVVSAIAAMGGAIAEAREADDGMPRVEH